MKIRPNIEEYMMMIAVAVRSRSTCTKPPTAPLGVGCVIVQDGKILGTGYSGSLRDQSHCIDVGHLLVNGSCIRTVHAEQNAVAQMSANGMAVANAVAYVTTHPCLSCAKLLAAVGVTKIVYLDDYKIDDDKRTRSVVPITFLKYTGEKYEVRLATTP